jgi:hypothetical protein
MYVLAVWQLSSNILKTQGWCRYKLRFPKGTWSWWTSCPQLRCRIGFVRAERLDKDEFTGVTSYNRV